MLLYKMACYSFNPSRKEIDIICDAINKLIARSTVETYQPILNYTLEYQHLHLHEFD